MSCTSSPASARCSRRVELDAPLGGDLGDQPLDLGGSAGRAASPRPPPDRAARGRALRSSAIDWRPARGMPGVGGSGSGAGAAAGRRRVRRGAGVRARRPKAGMATALIAAPPNSCQRRRWLPACGAAGSSAAESSSRTKATCRASSTMPVRKPLRGRHRRLAQRGGVADLPRQIGDRDVDLHLQRFFDLPPGQAAGHADAVQHHARRAAPAAGRAAAPAGAACRAPRPASAPSPARADATRSSRSRYSGTGANGTSATTKL